MGDSINVYTNDFLSKISWILFDIKETKEKISLDNITNSKLKNNKFLIVVGKNKDFTYVSKININCIEIKGAATNRNLIKVYKMDDSENINEGFSGNDNLLDTTDLSKVRSLILYDKIYKNYQTLHNIRTCRLENNKFLVVVGKNKALTYVYKININCIIALF